MARAALDPETAKPYHLQVVLRIAPNRLLTPIFRELVERQLGDSLQAALGEMAKVEIVRGHPLLKEVEAKGLQVALDGYSVLSDSKTHFVLVDFSNGRYEIRARQHDGFTGLASPVRRSSTADRQLVARSAALLINQDFGLAGTVDVVRNQDRVDVKLKGAGLGMPLGPWIHKGHVFAVTQITQGSDQQRRSFRMPSTLLQVLEEPRAEVCHCLLLHRFDKPLPSGRGVLGYRCVKLGTTTGPLRLRLVKDDKLRTPVAAVQVLISAREFEFGSRPETTTTNVDGLVKSAHAYDNVAFAHVSDSQILPARIPVEIIEDQTITCLLYVSAETAAQGELLERQKQWIRHVSEGLEVAANLFEELNALAGQSSERALARAQEGLKVLQSDISNLAAERDSLQADAANGPQKATPLNLKEGEQRLEDLQTQRKQLQRFIGDLQQIITEEKDPKRKELRALAKQAAFQEGEAEFDKAIQLYEQVRAGGGDTRELRKILDGLKRAWTPKSNAHAKARSFIYETWPKLETAAQINAQLDEAHKAFLICKESGDVLAPRKLLKTYVTHVSRLEKEVDALRPAEKEDDRKTAEMIIQLTPKLKEFNEQVKEYLRKTQPPVK